jgi:hypothetical protein
MFFPVVIGDLVVSVLSIGPKVLGSNPAEGDGYLTSTKIGQEQLPSGGKQSRRSHVVRFYGMLKNPAECEQILHKAKFIIYVANFS